MGVAAVPLLSDVLLDVQLIVFGYYYCIRTNFFVDLFNNTLEHIRDL